MFVMEVLLNSMSPFLIVHNILADVFTSNVFFLFRI